MSALPPEAITDLKHLAAARPCVAALFLFGSVARGDEHSGSDVDIGLLLTPDTPRDTLELLTLMEDIRGALGRQDVDVVVLNRADPLLLHRVARDGIVLYAKSNREVAEFHLYAFQQYEDTRPLRELEAEVLRERLTLPTRVGRPDP